MLAAFPLTSDHSQGQTLVEPLALPGVARHINKFLCKTTQPRLLYIIFNRAVVGKTTSLRKKSQQAHYYYRIATKLATAYHYLLLQFQ